MEDNNEMLRLILAKQDETLQEISEIKQFMAAQNVKNESIKENKADIKEIKETLSYVKRVTDDYIEFKGDIKKTLFEILRPPLAALGIIFFVGIAAVIWMSL